MWDKPFLYRRYLKDYIGDVSKKVRSRTFSFTVTLLLMVGIAVNQRLLPTYFKMGSIGQNSLKTLEDMCSHVIGVNGLPLNNILEVEILLLGELTIWNLSHLLVTTSTFW